MPPPPPDPVLVVGAGPTGLVAACLLADLGVRVLLVERRAGVADLPRAVHLDDEVLRVLQRLGLDEAFRACSRPARGMRLLDARREVLAEFRRDPARSLHGHPQANLFDQPDLERVLRDGVRARPLVALREGVELVDAPPGGAVLRAGDGTLERVRVAAVLGCDGTRSRLRELLGARLQTLAPDDRWLVVDVRCPEPLPMWPGVHQVCDPRRPATFLQVGPDRYRWEFRLGAGEPAEALTAPGVLAGLLRPELGGVPPARLEVLRAVPYVFRARVTDRWGDRRLFVLGDAAHETPPFVGQGLGAGVRDAANLTWKLARVLRDGADPALLDTYGPERDPQVRHVVRLAVTVGWALTGGGDRAARARRLALGALLRAPGDPVRLLDRPPPALPRGPLAARPRRALRSPVGRPVPQPWVARDGQRVRLDEVLGPGFALLSAGPVEPGLRHAAARLGARHVRLRTPGSLAPWLAGGVLVRPDRVVLATDARAAGEWLPLLTGAGDHDRPTLRP